MSYKPVAWKNAYTVDFTAQSSQNIRTGGNGTKTIDGKSWTWANDANSNTANVTSGTGIVLAASNTNVNYNGGTRNVPILTIPVTSLFSSYNIANHALRLQVRVLLTNSITNFEFVGAGFEYVTTPTNQGYRMLKGFSTTPNRIQTEDNVAGSTTIRQVSSSSSEDILGIIFRDPNNYFTMSGVFSSTPMNAGTNRTSVHPSGTTIAYATDLQVCLYYLTINTQGSTDGFQVTFTHLQLDYIELTPILGGF